MLAETPCPMSSDHYEIAFRLALKALQDITAEAHALQGDWQAFDYEIAPDWTHGYKRIENLADHAISQIEHISDDDFTAKTPPLPILSDEAIKVINHAIQRQGIVLDMTGEYASETAYLIEEGYIKTIHTEGSVFVGILTEKGRDLAYRLQS